MLDIPTAPRRFASEFKQKSTRNIKVSTSRLDAIIISRDFHILLNNYVHYNISFLNTNYSI